MRVSPALLACFSVVALSAQPSRAADATDTVESPPTLEANLETSSSETSSSETSAQTAVSAGGQPIEAAVAPVSTGSASTGSASTEGPTFSRLLAGVVDTSAPPMLAQDVLAQDVLAQDAPAEEVPAEDTPTDLPTGIPVEVEPAEAAPDALPIPSAPNDAPNSAPEGVEADEAAPADEDAAEQPEEENRVLVAEVDVVSTNPQRPLTSELIDAVYRAVGTVPGRTTTRTQLQQDINSVFGTGFFSNVSADPTDTPLGVKVTFAVEPNPVLTNVDVRGRQVLPDETVDEIFSGQYGQILNLRDFQDSVLDLTDWYEENGYLLAQVTAAPQISDDGVVTLIVAEGEIEAIEVRYITPDGDTTDEEGNPIGGRTRDFIITREFETQPGDVFQDAVFREDLARAFGLGILEDIRPALEPGDDDPRKVKIVVNIAERETGSVGASLGFNLRGDLFGQLSYNEDNFGGNNQKLRTEGRVTTRGDFLFDVSFTDPWIAGDPYRTSYTASLFNRRATSLIFDNGPIEVNLPNGDTPRINRLGTGISFSRPLNNGLSLSLGTQYERVAALDGGSTVTPRDSLGNLLTASDSGRDDLLTVQFGAVLDRRNNPSVPTAGSLFRLGTEQAIPIGNGSIFFNKIRGSYSQYIPVSFFGDSGRETIAFNIQGGTTLGEIPPYEAFPLGGGNSVRGFEEGAVGSGRSFMLSTVEYRFPLFSEFLNGALFADYGTDLGSGSSVPGDPAGVRGKPGNGFGYGAGVRVQTPLGALRLDYGLSDDGGSRFHFGFGERF
ncbi:MAG: BamA/TamA family outer membrane protein [Cyanobacteria bacterium J06643_4]